MTLTGPVVWPHQNPGASGTGAAAGLDAMPSDLPGLLSRRVDCSENRNALLHMNTSCLRFASRYI